MIRSALFAASAAAAVLFSTAASADTREIQTSDLDLSTVAGQTKLDKRIAAAARAVCKVQLTGSRIANVDEECRAKAAASAREALAARGLTTKSGG